jgi:hypothetical protein
MAEKAQDQVFWDAFGICGEVINSLHKVKVSKSVSE